MALYIRYNTQTTLSYEWDPGKRERTLVDRDVDFADAVLVFEGPTLEDVDTRRAHSEVRVLAVGVAHGRFLTLVYTDRPRLDGQIIRRIISARRSNRRERQAYTHAIIPR